MTSATTKPEKSVPDPAAQASTRERILDIALDLFADQGFDKTSLRDIAERLGFTKAAIYYHFASKEDILLALHLRMHEMYEDLVERLGDGGPVTPDVLAAVLDELVGRTLENRKLFVMHVVNRAAFENVQHDHSEDHPDIEQRFQDVFSDPQLALGERVRMACAFGALMGFMMMGGQAFASEPTGDLIDELRGAIRDLLDPVLPRTKRGRARPAAKPGGRPAAGG